MTTKRFLVKLLVAMVMMTYLLLWMKNDNNVRKTRNVQIRNKTEDFDIHVLTWNRPHSFSRLLDSLNVSIYEGDPVHLFIHIDNGNNTQTCDIAEKYPWRHGKKTVVKALENQGLAKSWFNAWYPRTNKSRAIIFEDDIVVSRHWYKWLNKAWDVYGKRKDLAGITLLRQTLIPKGPRKLRHREIVNDHLPFLYKLPGSTGLSPHPNHWRKFMDWIRGVDYKTVNVFVQDLITSHWWKDGDKRNMWTQHFIHFCNKNKLYHLYVNLPNGTTLASNMQEAGMHYLKNLGADFPLAKEVKFEFPAALKKYSWEGRLWPFYDEPLLPLF